MKQVLDGDRIPWIGGVRPQVDGCRLIEREKSVVDQKSDECAHEGLGDRERSHVGVLVIGRVVALVDDLVVMNDDDTTETSLTIDIEHVVDDGVDVGRVE